MYHSRTLCQKVVASSIHYLHHKDFISNTIWFKSCVVTLYQTASKKKLYPVKFTDLSHFLFPVPPENAIQIRLFVVDVALAAALAQTRRVLPPMKRGERAKEEKLGDNVC